MKTVRCNGCRKFFDITLHWCPNCGHERPRYNRYSQAIALNRDLNTKAEAGHRELQHYNASMRGYEPPVDKRILKTAKQIVKDM